MKTLKVQQKIETLLDFPVSWQQCYSWFEELPTGGSTMEECNTTAQQQCKMAAPLSTCTREEQRSVIRFLSSGGLNPLKFIEEWKCSMVKHVYHYSKCMSGLGSF
jgi:hypothetical protein